jgi:hypothetical protein
MQSALGDFLLLLVLLLLLLCLLFPFFLYAIMWILPLVGYFGVVVGFAFLTLAIGMEKKSSCGITNTNFK